MRTEKKTRTATSDMRPEYDLASLGPGVRGKYYERAKAGSNLVLLEPDVAKAFPTSEAVNTALRLLAEVAASTASRARRTGKARRGSPLDHETAPRSR